MRLTIGGALIFLGIGATAGFFIADKAYIDLAKSKVKGLTDQAGSLVGLFNFGKEEKKPEVYSPPPPFPTAGGNQTAGAGIATSSGPAIATSSLPLVAVPLVEAPLAESTPAVATKPAKKPLRKSRRSRTAKASAAPVAKKPSVKAKAPVKKVAAKPAPKPAPVKDKTQALIGTYVSLELITGRSVQGVLQSKSATHYSLNVPGLGPLEYPIENVKSILPAN